MFLRRRTIGPGAALLVACASFAVGAQDDTTRSITPERFLKARPAAAAATPARPTYRPANPRKPALKAPAGSETAKPGAPNWRLRAAKPRDAARLPVQAAASTATWQPAA